MLNKLAILFLLLSVLTVGVYAQMGSNVRVSDKGHNFLQPSDERIVFYSDSVAKALNEPELIVLSIADIYHEVVPNLNPIISINGTEQQVTPNNEGLFYSILKSKGSKTVVDISVNHKHYHKLDTSFIFMQGDQQIIKLALTPKYKILLKGRVFISNLPAEDVHVEIIHLTDTFKLNTLGCYTDSEEYWNCLYLGMFKQEIVSDNPEDEISFRFSKVGMKDLAYQLKFNEYDGELLNLKMKFSNALSYFPKNNIAFKVGFPFAEGKNWLINLSYTRQLNIAGFQRIGLGLEASTLISSHKVQHNTFPGLEVSSHDTSYVSTFVGPTALIWITDPINRVISIYAGANASYIINTGSISFQPFIGARSFLDQNKALNLEIRHINYNVDVTHFDFNPYGKASTNIINQTFNQFLINLGLHVTF